MFCFDRDINRSKKRFLVYEGGPKQGWPGIRVGDLKLYNFKLSKL